MWSESAMLPGRIEDNVPCARGLFWEPREDDVWFLVQLASKSLDSLLPRWFSSAGRIIEGTPPFVEASLRVMVPTSRTTWFDGMIGSSLVYQHLSPTSRTGIRRRFARQYRKYRLARLNLQQMPSNEHRPLLIGQHFIANGRPQLRCSCTRKLGNPTAECVVPCEVSENTGHSVFRASTSSANVPIIGIAHSMDGSCSLFNVEMPRPYPCFRPRDPHPPLVRARQVEPV
ncbi:hypothetical protein LX32DRAFT_356649 [Colletotrichum zoysiae]|uniref:Uncharacterized protein n=1 Tax=Colletotrichum zoysiae TaxID=1216348 RepID=A0AAD9M5D9_9PEZI|nr:hypothetical protein LX32DRAFT_356649 [Colletotrichum zoysiae]